MKSVKSRPQSFASRPTSQPFRVTLIGSRVIEECQVKMISSSSLFFLILVISVQFAASLPTNSDEYEYPNDAEGDEYEYEDERSDEKFVAKELDVKITSEKKHVVVGEEDVIRLQCLVENNGESIWSTSFLFVNSRNWFWRQYQISRWVSAQLLTQHSETKLEKKKYV